MKISLNITSMEHLCNTTYLIYKELKYYKTFHNLDYLNFIEYFT